MDAVALTLSAGSVVFTADIAVASAAAATSTTSRLANGALKDASTLQSALAAQFQADGVSTATLSVEVVAPPGSGVAPPTPSPAGLSTGALIGIIAGVAVALLLVVVVLYCKFCRKVGPNARSKPPSTTTATVKKHQSPDDISV